ncbi:RraA family protein [Brevibacillus ginsengisoli]|uniref:RraA family protein n=1 Tax=Brevibacillus ginsengisoli TaxID=363854 RepID=UPI003CF431B2
MVERTVNRCIPTTCLSDAMGGLNNLDPAIKPLHEKLKVRGKAFTVKVRAADNLMVLRAIYEASPGDILVIDAKGYEYNAVCGDFVIGLAQILGIEGVVIDGVIRDVKGIKEMNYPVFCRGYTVAASGKSGAGEINVPISCGGVVVHPGDIVVGDADGVVVIPQAQEQEIYAKAIDKLNKDKEREEEALSNPEAARRYLASLFKK